MNAILRISLASVLLMLPATIFWIWLTVQAIRVMRLCPSGCWCDPSGSKIDCSNASLRSIPTTFHEGAKSLDLDYNNFTKLQKDTFSIGELEKLEFLSLDHCNLITLEPGVFSGLNELKQLSIMNNFLQEIKPGIFKNLTRLKEIYLAYNRIRVLEVDAFSGLDNLYYLLLRGNNIKVLSSDVFINIPTLKYLELDGNYDIINPNTEPLLNAPNLKGLYLNNCNISTVKGLSLGNSSELEILELGKNNLRHIDTSIFTNFPKLSELNLYGNPLDCNCDLKKVWNFCNSNSILTASGGVPTCSSPDEVEGLWWGVLQLSQCRDDAISFHGDYRNLIYENDYKPVVNSEFEKYRIFIKYGQSVTYSVLFLFGATGNITLIIIIMCNQKLRTMPNMYILNLAFSDLLTLILNLVATHLHALMFTWESSQFMCQLYMFLRRMSVGSAAYSVAVLSVHRYHVTSRPFDNRIHRSEAKRFTVISLIGVWIISALFALPTAFSMHADLYCSMLDSLDYYKKVVIFDAFVCCVIPLLVTAFMYVMTARILVQNSRSFRSDIANTQADVHKKTAKIVVGLAIVFIVSFVPYHLLWAIVLWNDELGQEMTLFYVYFASTCLLVFNSCFNPVAVCFSSSVFRLHFKRYLLCCCNRHQVQGKNGTINSSEETYV